MKFNILKTKKNKEKSLGRSMVEMLGVLAIIGVLSIGGIQGYTIAMRRFRANEILNVANKYALIIYTDLKNKMMDQTDDLYIDEYGRWIGPRGSQLFPDDVVAFSESGIGGMPSGAQQIELHDVYTNQSGDLVVLFLELEDQRLCQTVYQLSGTEGVNGKESRFNCTHNSYGDDSKFAIVTFIMN